MCSVCSGGCRGGGGDGGYGWWRCGVVVSEGVDLWSELSKHRPSSDYPRLRCTKIWRLTNVKNHVSARDLWSELSKHRPSSDYPGCAARKNIGLLTLKNHVCSLPSLNR